MVMTLSKSVIISTVLSLLAGASVVSAASGQLGVGYGKQLLGNTDISQLELFYRMPLSYQKELGDVWKLSTAIEFGGAIIDDSESETSTTGRLSLMPQMLLSPNDAVHFFIGLGSGFMMGETKFEDHDLGGPFFLSSKVGVLFVIAEHFGVEYNYYHQSNGGIYDFNASLNMHHLSLSYRF
jgi:Lipid A 3-O-deacylase (PagL)